MTREQVARAVEVARIHERLRSWSSGTPQDQAVIRGLEQAHEEWLRIAYVMCVEKMTTYQLDQDPAVHFWFRDDGPEGCGPGLSPGSGSGQECLCLDCAPVRSA
ncbi:hypothetical protein EDD99_7997 [Streptomyces sp. 846.5]|nr:hypothetical protein EDD99_7997 [Streptomyces sp. 846.5]